MCRDSIEEQKPCQVLPDRDETKNKHYEQTLLLVSV